MSSSCKQNPTPKILQLSSVQGFVWSQSNWRPCARTILQDKPIHSRSKLKTSQTKQTTAATLATEEILQCFSRRAQAFPQERLRKVRAGLLQRGFGLLQSCFTRLTAVLTWLQLLSCGPSSLFSSFSVHHLMRLRRSQSGVRARSADLSALRQLSLTSATSSLPSLSSRFACSSGFSAPKRSMETCGT